MKKLWFLNLLMVVQLFGCKASPTDTNYWSEQSVIDKNLGSRIEVFSKYEGRWVTTVTGNAEDPWGEQIVRKVEWVGRFILQDSLFEIHGYEVTDEDVIEFVWLFGYDQDSRRYVAFYHDAEGTHMRLAQDYVEETGKISLYAKQAYLGSDVRMSLDLTEIERFKYIFTIGSSLQGPADFFERGVAVPK